MIFNNVYLQSIAHNTDGETLSTSTIEKRLSPLYERLKLSEGRLHLMTGISERKVFPLGTPPSQIATVAAERALKNKSLDKSKIDLLIHSSVCRDFLEPSTASVIHKNLGLSPHCLIFDLSNACLGMLNGVHVASSMIELGQIQKALIVSGENSSPLIENTISQLLNDQTLNRKSLKKYFANLTIGSAGVAIVLSSKKGIDPLHYPSIIGGAYQTDSSANHLCQGNGNTHELTMQTDSEQLLHAGIPLAQATFRNFKEKFSLNQKGVDWAISHQVGLAHEQTVKKALELEDTPTYLSYPKFGNTGSAALFLTLSLLMQDFETRKKIEPKSLMALLGIGSGLVSMILGLKWPSLRNDL